MSEITYRGGVSGLVRVAGLFAVNLGFDPRAVGASRNLQRFWRDYRTYNRKGGSIASLHPILTDYAEQAGSGSGHYFHQDLLVARMIFEHGPARHIDIGSRIDGFVAHVAAFREIDLIDIRPLEKSPHANMKFLQADLMERDESMVAIADSVSSLHALEHFGLGRYGDAIDPEGHIKGLRNIARLVKPGGRLYIGFPIGRETQVFFNAHRIFHPRDIFTWFEDPELFQLQRFDHIDDEGDLHTHSDVNADLAVEHGCGIYTFERAK